MNKTLFISVVTPVLREMGFKKNKNYWYRYCKEYIECINVQGSQWDKNDYLVEIGFAQTNLPQKFPTILYWHCRHSVFGVAGQYNILPQELFDKLKIVFDSISSKEDLTEYLIKQNAIKVGTQYHWS